MVLGCAKNQVDAEEMAVRLEQAGYTVSADPAAADLIIVHTCGFIEKARRESIRALIDLVSLKQDAQKQKGDQGKGDQGEDNTGSPKILVTGCLSQRYPRELIEEIPEIDGLAGTQAPRDIVELVRRVLSGERVVEVGPPGRGVPGTCGGEISGAPGFRYRPESRPWAYVRVAEGCRRRCTYCAIPSMRGPLASRPLEDIVKEVESLSVAGVREINLIAQDLGDYGVDLWGRQLLPELLLHLSDVPGISWIRLLYVHPDGVTSEFARAMAGSKAVPYLDMPIEHGSARILKLMGRPGPDRIRQAVNTLREHVPGIFLRTSVIVGFPGETRRDFEETMELLAECEFHRVAVFGYSMEEGTPAASLPGSVPSQTRARRIREMQHFSTALARQSSLRLEGKVIDVMLERPALQEGWWVARGVHQAPEVDGKVFLRIGSRSEPRRGDIRHGRVSSPGILHLWAREEPG